MDKHFFKFRLLGIAAFLAMVAAFSVLVMLLWNALMPELFRLPLVNYLQAAGLVVLARILFGGIGNGRLPHGWIDRDSRLFPHNVLREKWMNMSEDERREFMRHHYHGFGRFEEGRGRCGRGAPAEGTQSASADYGSKDERDFGRSPKSQDNPQGGLSGFPPHDKKEGEEK